MPQVKSSEQLPFVSVIIPLRNEEKFVAQSLDSIVSNDYPRDKMEILVVDGRSTDRSREIVEEYMRKYPFIKLLDNPKKIRVSANNIGIKAARGEIIISMDAHVIYAPDYIRNCVELLQSTGAANVGGLQKAVGYNYLTKAIALATTTPFGIGDAEFRYLKKEKWVDTVYLGAWRKSTLESVGLFNEGWVRNGDYELNYRIRKAGGKILLSPKIRCQYIVRGSLKKLARQYLLYGIWRVKTIKTHPDSIRWRHLIPPALLIWLFLSIISLAVGLKYWWIPVASYFFYTAATSLAISIRHGIIYFPLLILIFWVLHISWGLGFLYGILKFGPPKIPIGQILKDILGKQKFDRC